MQNKLLFICEYFPTLEGKILASSFELRKYFGCPKHNLLCSLEHKFKVWKLHVKIEEFACGNACLRLVILSVVFNK